MYAPLRNGLVMLPATAAPAEPVPCNPQPMLHIPQSVAVLTPVAAGMLMPGALVLLCLTAEAWAPLREADAVPMPHAVRKRWEKLRKAYRRSAGRGYIDAENQEWFSLPEELRVAILLLAHIEGDLKALANRDWRETPPAERAAIKCAMRSVKRHSGRMVALASLW